MLKRFGREKILKRLLRMNFIESTDLFVLGAHSKSALIDFMVGSLNKYLIKLDRKPLLIG